MMGRSLSDYSCSLTNRLCILPQGVSRRRLFGAGGVSRLVIAMLISGQMMAADFASAAEAIGAVERIKSTSYGTPPGEARTAKQLNDPLVFKELLETLSFSALEANLLDGSVLTLGSSARVVLDEFVYDPSAAATGAVLGMTEGSLRFVSGNIPKEAFKVTTPLCTIAIRGTNFKVRVEGNGDTLVAVDDGAVVVTVASSGEDIVVNEGQSVEIRRTGSAAAPLDEVDFYDDDVLEVGNQIVDYGWGDEVIEEKGTDQADQASEEGEATGASGILIFTPLKPKSKESGGGKGGGDGGGEGGGD